MEPDKTNPYRIERMSQSGFPHLIALYKACFGVSETMDYFEKKYGTQVFGASFVGYLAFDKLSGEAAAYYGVFPMRANLKGESILVAQSGDTMTHPKHQGKGLFVTLANLTYELAKKEKIEFVFGFPNQNSYPGFVRKLNWVHSHDINNYKIKTGSLPFDKLALKVKLFAPFYAWYVQKRLKGFESKQRLENSTLLLEPNKGFIEYDEKFYNYKSYYKHYLICIGGIDCVLKVDGRIWIGDCGAYTEDDFNKFVVDLRKLARKLGSAAIQFSVFETGQFDSWLQKKYKPEMKNAVGYLNLSGKYNPEEFVFQAFDFDTF